MSRLGGPQAVTPWPRTLRRMLVAVLLALAVVVPVAAWAYFSAGSAPGGGGQAAAATVPQGGTPTATGTGSTVTVTWSPTSLSNGRPADGYRIARYDAMGALQPVGAGCSGVVTDTSCMETSVPSGTWTYTVTPVLSTSWVGAESAMSAPLTTDARLPSNVLSLSNVTGGAALQGSTVYYRGAAAGSFRLTNAVTAPGLGPVSSRTSALGSDSTGWTHTPSTVITPLGGPYVSNAFSWTAATTSSPTETVTGRSVVGNQAVDSLTFVDDSVPPSGDAVSYPDGSAGGTSVEVDLTTGTDAGSGLGTRLLQRASAPRSGTSCGAFGSFSTVATNPVSPYVDSIVAGSCYQYQYVVADNVGNVDVVTSSSVVHTPDGAEWDFEEGSGSTAADSTGNGHTATLGAGAGWTVGKVHAGALSLTGAADSYASTPGPVVDTGQSFTVAAWVKFDSTSGFQTLASIDGTNLSPFYLQLRGDGVFAFGLFASDSLGSSYTSVTGLAPSPGVWYHVAGVYDQAAHTSTLYVNGSSQGTLTGASTFTATGDTTIGRALYGGPTNYVDGAVDDVRFYDSVLSPSQVAALAAAGNASGPTGGSVDATGLGGTGSRYSTSTTLSLALAQGTDPDGLATSGDRLFRATAPLSGGTCGTYGSDVQVGGNDPSASTTDTVSDQACYRYSYRVLDAQGNGTTYTSPDIKVHTTAPSAPVLSFSALSNVFVRGGTVYYRPGASSGSFTVTASSADPASGIAGYAFPTLGAGWTANPGGAGVTTYSWSGANPAAPGSVAVTATDGAGSSASTPLALTADGTPPSAGTISYPDGETSSRTVAVSFTSGTDTDAGVASRLLQRASAPRSGGLCGTYTSFATVSGGTEPASPFSDTIDGGTCYQYRYVVTDNVGNSDIATSSHVVFLAPGAEWDFEEGSGSTAADSTGNGHTATLRSGAGWTTGKVNATALSLSRATGSYASAPGPVVDTGRSFTVAAWVKFASTSGYQTIASIDGTNVSSFYLQLRGDGVLAFETYGSDGTGGSSSTSVGLSPSAGVWYHVAGVYDQAAHTSTLYVDGSSQGTSPGAASFAASGDTNIGRANYGGPVDYLDGAVDDVHFFDQALTSSQVAALAGTGNPGPTGGSVDATGLGGTGSRYSTSTTLSLALAQGTDPDGLATSGDRLSRATAPLSGGTCGTYGAYVQVAVDPGSSVSDSVANQACYRYAYRVLDGNGDATTFTSPDIKVDTTAPSAPSLSFSGLTNTYVTTSGGGSTVYFQPGAASGSFTVTASSTDPVAGLTGYTFPALGSGWTATPGGSGVVTYSWSASNPAAPGGLAVTANNNAGSTASTGFTVTADGTAPTAGTISYPDGTATAGTVSVSFTTGTDAGSGIATRLLQRASAPLSGGVCGSYSSYATVTGGSNPTSPFSDAITTGACYTYRYVVTDNLGNSNVATSSSVVLVRPTYEQTVVATSGLHSYYKLGESAGATTLADYLGVDNGTYVGGVSLGLPGALAGGTDTAAGFDGNDDYARITRQVSGNFSLEFWFNSTQGIGTGGQWWEGAGLVDAEVSGPYHDFGVSLRSDGRVVAGVGTPDVSVVSSLGGLNDGSWHHVVFTRTQSTGAIVLYVDGTNVGSATASTGSLTDPVDIDFGRIASGSNYYAGRLDDVAVYDSVLSPATVQDHFASR